MPKGGSSVGGSNPIPDYMESVHADWLDVSTAGVLSDTIDLTVVDAMNVAFGSASPYNSFSYINPSTALQRMSNSLGEMTTLLSGLDPSVDWDSYFNKAALEVSEILDDDHLVVAQLMADGWETLDDEAQAQMATFITSASPNAVLAYLRTWTTMYSAVLAKIGLISDVSITIKNANATFASIASGVKSIADTDVQDTKSSTLKDDFTAWSTLFDTASTKLDTILTAGNYQLIDPTKYELDTGYLLTDVEITTIVAAAESDNSPEYEKRLAEFSAGMGAIGAINSSGYMIGMAMLMRDRDKASNLLRATLIDKRQDRKAEAYIKKTEFLIKYQQDMQKFRAQYYADRLSAISALVQVSSSTDISRASKYGDALMLHSSLHEKFLETMNRVATDIDIAKVSGYKEGLLTYQKNRIDFMNAQTQGAIQQDRTRADIAQKVYDNYEGRKLNYVQQATKAMVQLLVVQQQVRMGAIAGGTSEMVRYKMFMTDYQKAITSLKLDKERIDIVAMNEWKSKELDLDIKDALWDLNIFQYGSNVLSAVGTGGTIVPEGPTPGQSALGGALSGAALGLKATGGNPLGAIGGAILGGIGGYLGAA